MSILSQNIHPSLYEIICIDDVGEDNSINIIRHIKLEKNLTNLKIISHKINKGLSAARNTGIKYALGEYISFIDADDYLIEGCFTKLIKVMSQKSFDVLELKMSEKYEAKSITYSPIKKTFSSLDEITGDLYFYKRCQLNEFNTTVVTRIYRRNLLQNNLYFTESIYFEDEDFIPRVYMMANRCFSLDLDYYVYRRRDNSITTTVFNSYKWIYDYMYIAERLFQLSQQNFISSFYLKKRAADLILSIIKNLAFYKSPNSVIDLAISEISKKDFSRYFKKLGMKYYFQFILLKHPKLFYLFSCLKYKLGNII